MKSASWVNIFYDVRYKHCTSQPLVYVKNNIIPLKNIIAHGVYMVYISIVLMP